jgi:hypothetical protein
MPRTVFAGSRGWRSLGIAAVLLATIPGPSPAARQGGVAVVTAPEGPIVDVGEAAASGSWVRARRGREAGPVEVRFDDILRAIGTGGLRMDRESLRKLGQTALGAEADVETLTVGQALDHVGRIRVSSQGMSVLVGRRTLLRVLRNLLGSDEPVDGLAMRDVLDRLAGAEVTADGVMGRLSQQTLLAALGGGLLGRIQRPDHAGDPEFAQRAALQRRYQDVEALIRQVRREGATGGEPGALYDETYNRLLKANGADAVPLLDGILRLEDELASALLPSMSRAERIQARWPARRRAFGEDMARLLFSRKEAIERYEIDRLAIAADEAATPQARAQRLAARRQALKVELAAQGSYVAFSDPAPAAAAVAAPAAIAAPEPGLRRRQR